MQVSSLRFVFTVSLASLWLKSQVLLYWKAEKILSLFCFVARLWLLISYSGLSKIALKATALIDLILKKVQKAQREAAPGVTEPRGRVCAVCVWDAGRRGSLGRGQVDTTLESMSGLGYSFNTLPLISVYISSESDYITTIFGIYTPSCVCICVCKRFNSAPQPDFSKSPCLWFKSVNGG